MKGGHQCVVFDLNAEAVKAVAGAGASPRPDLDDFLEAQNAAGHLVDGAGRGRGCHRRLVAETAKGRHPHRRRQFATTSTTFAGPRNWPPRASTTWTSAPAAASGACERGYCMMIGGDEAAVKHLDPIFKTLAPGIGDHRPDAGRRQDRRYRRAGLSALRAVRRRPLRQDGAQRHRVRHDGRLCRRAQHAQTCQCRQAGARNDAETTPLRYPEHYQYDLNLPDDHRGVAARQRRGLVAARPHRQRMVENPSLSNFAGRVSDSGEGRWTLLAAIEEGSPARFSVPPCIERFISRGEAEFADKLLSAMRFELAATKRNTVNSPYKCRVVSPR